MREFSEDAREYLMALIGVDNGENAEPEVVLEIIAVLGGTEAERLEACDDLIDMHAHPEGTPDTCPTCDWLYGMRADAHAV